MTLLNSFSSTDIAHSYTDKFILHVRLRFPLVGRILPKGEECLEEKERHKVHEIKEQRGSEKNSAELT